MDQLLHKDPKELQYIEVIVFKKDLTFSFCVGDFLIEIRAVSTIVASNNCIWSNF